MDSNRKNALLSVYNKSGIASFGEELIKRGFRLWSSGGTAAALRKCELEVADIATLVGPPILGHRVVTLSREIHAGLLARNTPEDLAELQRINTPWFELVCVDLYPLETEAQQDGATMESVIEKTDIGGPTLLRSAAKGRRLVITYPEDRFMILDRLDHDKFGGSWVSALPCGTGRAQSRRVLRSLRGLHLCPHLNKYFLSPYAVRLLVARPFLYIWI